MNVERVFDRVVEREATWRHASARRRRARASDRVEFGSLGVLRRGRRCLARVERSARGGRSARSPVTDASTVVTPDDTRLLSGEEGGDRD